VSSPTPAPPSSCPCILPLSHLPCLSLLVYLRCLLSLAPLPDAAGPFQGIPFHPKDQCADPFHPGTLSPLASQVPLVPFARPTLRHMPRRYNGGTRRDSSRIPGVTRPGRWVKKVTAKENPWFFHGSPMKKGWDGTHWGSGKKRNRWEGSLEGPILSKHGPTVAPSNLVDDKTEVDVKLLDGGSKHLGSWRRTPNHQIQTSLVTDEDTIMEELIWYAMTCWLG